MPRFLQLREPDELTKLPEDERKACRRRWADVEGLRKRLSGPK
jgi:hypothetical protein